MVRYGIVVDGKAIPIWVVSTMTWGGKQQTVVYESPGADGGTVLLTGRVTRQRTLTGKILQQGKLSLTAIKNVFDTVRDTGKIVTLISPVDDNDTGRFIIEDFNGTVEPGIESYLGFTMVLTEYRQANVQRAQANLISFEPANRIRQLIKDRNITPT